MEREPAAWAWTRGRVLYAASGAACVVIAVVALVLGHEGIAAIVGFVGSWVLILFVADMDENRPTWGSAHRRWSMSEAEFSNLVEEAELRASSSSGHQSEHK